MSIKNCFTGVLFLTLVCLSYSYQSTNTLSNSLFQTGRIVLNKNPSGESYSYIITFKVSFKQDANVIVAFAKLKLCSSNLVDDFTILYNEVPAKTNNEIFLYFARNNDIQSFELNYLAIDAVNSDHLYFYRGWLTMEFNSFYWDTSENRFNVSDPNVFITCFLTSVGGTQIANLPYKIAVQCSKLDDHTIRIQTKNQMTSYPAVFFLDENGTRRFHKTVAYTLVAIKQDSSLQVTSNTLSAFTNADSTPISVNQDSQINYYYIGLRAYNLPTRCFDFQLTSDNKKIISGSFNQIDFDYFIVSRNQSGISSARLNYIESRTFTTQILLCFSNIMNTTQLKFNQFIINSTSVISLVDLHPMTNPGEYYLLADLVSAIDSSEIQISFSFFYASRICDRNTAFRLIAINQIVLDPIQNKFQMTILNLRGGAQSKFNYLPNLKWEKGTQQGDDYTIDFSFSLGVIGTYSWIVYEDTGKDGFGDHVNMQFYLPKVIKIQSSAITNTLIITINLMPASIPATSTQFSESSDYIENLQVTPGGSVVIEFDYIKSAGATYSSLQIDYQWSTISSFKMKFALKLLTIFSVKSLKDTRTFQFRFINFHNTQNFQVSNFNITDTRITPKMITIRDGQIILTVICDASLNSDAFDLEINHPSISVSAFVTDVRAINRFIKISAVQFQNNLDIYLSNPDNLTNSTLPKMILNNPYLIVNSIEVQSDNTIKISTSYNNTVDGFQLQVSHDFDQDTVFLEITSFPLVYDFALRFCIQNRQYLSNIYRIFASVMQYMYLIFFFYSVICNNKLLALQTIFLIQLTYFSMIPIGLNCTNLGLNAMKYVIGINPFFKSLPQQKIPMAFSDLGFSSNFISNVNFMMMILFACPFMYLILIFFAKRSTSYKTKPRLIRCAKMFILQFPLTMLLYSSFNIYGSLVIDIQYLGTSDRLSMGIGLLSSLFLPVYAIIYWFFRSHFHQFADKFDPIQRIGSLSKETSIIIRSIYPLVLITQFSLVPLFLAIQALSSYSLYISLVFSILGFVYILVATPYIHKLDNIRLIIHRSLALAICIILIVFKKMTQYGDPKQEFIFFIPLVLLIIVAVGLLINGSEIIRLSLKWFKKKGIIDHQMKVQQEGTNKKPAPEPYQYNPQKWYPKLQFSRFKRNPTKQVVGAFSRQQIIDHLAQRNKQSNFPEQPFKDHHQVEEGFLINAQHI